MKNILWIEDDAEILRNLFFFIEKEGFKVTAAKTYNEYLDISSQEFRTFEIAVVDLLIPPGNGKLPTDDILVWIWGRC